MFFSNKSFKTSNNAPKKILFFLSQILHFTHIFERNKTGWKSGFSPIHKHLVHFSWFKKKSTTRIVVWSYYLNLCERKLSDSEIESDLEEDIVFGKLFDFSRDWVFIVLTVLIMKMFDIKNNSGIVSI
jgi:hypothetical protein